VYNFDAPATLLKNIDLPGVGTVIGCVGTPDSSDLMIKFMSFNDPGSLWKVDMNTF